MSFIKSVSTIVIFSLLVSCSSVPIKYLVDVPHELPVPTPVRNVEIALVLGGGGARAIAQAGVIEILEKHHIPIDLIVGCSAGSIVGALYADDPNYQHLHSKIININKWDVLDPSIMDTIAGLSQLRGPVRGLGLQRFLLNNLHSKRFEDLKIPLVAVTTDIRSNELFLISSGPIIPAVHASSAIPPVFSPVYIYNRILIDGGVISPVPVEVARLYNPKLIIVVDISAPPAKDGLNNMFNLTYRSTEIFYYRLSRMEAKLADINIHPKLYGTGMFDDHEKAKLYEAGKVAALEHINLIKASMNRLKINPR